MKSPMQKGKNFEREVAKILSDKMGLKYKDSIRRTPCSGGLHTFMSQDIICLDTNSILYNLFIECKKRQKVDLHTVYWRTKALDLCRADKIACVISAKNFDKEPIITLGLEDFLNYLLEIEQLRNKSNLEKELK